MCEYTCSATKAGTPIQRQKLRWVISWKIPTVECEGGHLNHVINLYIRHISAYAHCKKSLLMCECFVAQYYVRRNKKQVLVFIRSLL